MRRRQNRIAIEDALFNLKKGAAYEIAEEAGLPETTAIMHLKGLVEEKMAQWGKLFLGSGYTSARYYSLTSRGRMIIDPRRTVQGDVTYMLYEQPVRAPDNFDGIEELIRTGYMGATVRTDNE